MQNKKKQAPKKTHKDWDSDRHAGILLQRNILFLLCITSLACVAVAMLTVKSMIEKNSIEPYVVAVNEIDKMPVAINNKSVKDYANANTAIVEYFLMKYVTAREGYNPATWEYDYKTLVPAFSRSDIYRTFRKTAIDDEQSNIPKKYGNSNIEVVVKQISTTTKTNITVMRISKKSSQGGTNNGGTVTSYQITIHYTFDTLNITVGDVAMNPLGIKIDSYDVLEEKTFVQDNQQPFKT